jgi:hypothetical protein
MEQPDQSGLRQVLHPGFGGGTGDVQLLADRGVLQGLSLPGGNYQKCLPQDFSIQGLSPF